MATHDRLRRLMEDDLGSCQEEDFERRVEKLAALEDAIGGTVALDVDAFSALANETRYKIVRVLDAAEDELCVCEFAPLLDVTDGAISQALSKLVDAGLVTRRKDGKWRRYRTTRRATALLVALDGSREAETQLG